MRIIVFLNSLYTGGAEFSTLSFYGWLSKNGYSVKLVCCKKANPSYDPVQFGLPEAEYLTGKNIFGCIQSLRQTIQEFNPLLVHSVLFQANIMTRFVRILNSNFVHLESLVNEMYSPFRLADPNITKLKLEGYRWLDKLTQHWGVDHFHANGISVAKHYQQQLGIASERITIIPRGRKANTFLGDLQNREKLRSALITGDRLMIMHVARHEYQKGQDLLLDAVNLLGEKKEKIQVVLVGREGNLTSVINNKITAYGLKGCVVTLGHRLDVAALLAAADLFVFPSRFEGLPGALIEAEAAGLPIVCTDIPNNREVAREGVNAFLFPINDTLTLANSLIKLLGDAALRREMGRQSVAIFEQNFLLEEVHLRMKMLIESLIAKARK